MGGTQDAPTRVRGLDLIKDGWFSERGEMWPGQATSLQVESILHHETSEFQDILVFKSTNHGVVLILDGVIQCTQHDEFAYQEMISHLPLFSHPNPRKVLVIGGGDGGVVREILRHPCVESIHLCEIDERVIEVSKKYLPFMSSSFSDPKVTVHIKDGAKFMAENPQKFDVIITDSSDPIGPAEVLFEMPFYQGMHRSLRDGGIICTQGECMWLDATMIRKLIDGCRNTFAVVEYAYITIPTYPSGQIGFILCAKSDTTDFKNPVRHPTESVQQRLKYYNPEIHSASLVLPQFAKRALLGSSG